MPRISYVSEGFPPRTIRNGTADVSVTWSDILWAAVTVGRPNRNYVFRHGDSSQYEAVFRWSLVRMALQQTSLAGYRLHRTDAAKTLDPTEKGAVSYFLGMTFCKLFAWKLLNTPWLLHLDVFRPMLNPVLRGRSRPDLVGKRHGTSRWHAFECKGRISPPNSTAKNNAKAQAQRLRSVNRIPCSLHIGAITYFRNDLLQFYWKDPPPEQANPIEVPFEAHAWRYYYAPILQVVVESEGQSVLQTDQRVVVAVDGLDLEVSIYPPVAKLLFKQQWDAAQRLSEDAAKEITSAGYQPDGLKVKAGDSWSRRFKEVSST